VALAVLAAGAGFAWRTWRGPGEDLLLASGTIEATEVDASFKVAGRLVERLADEGDRVEAGQPLARLDSPELEADVRRLRAALAATETRLPQLRTEIAWREELTRRRVAEAAAVLAAREARLAELRAGSRPQEVAEARAVLAAREARVAELRAGSRPQEVQQAEAAVREAQAVLARARQDLERLERLVETGAVSRQEQDVARTSHDVAAERLRSARERLALVGEGPRPEEIRRAEAEVEQARARLALLVEGARPEEIRRAEAEVEQARAALAGARAGELEVALRRQEVATLEANVVRDRAALAAAEAQLADTRIASPLAAVVLRAHAEPGEVLAAGTPVLTLADLGRTWLRVYVPEPRLGRVKLGQAADVTTDSYPGKVYRGAVTFISAEAEFTPKNVQTPEERVKLVFAVKITVENPDQELKPGMPADARLRLR
jgi:HlyD family secretion protein